MICLSSAATSLRSCTNHSRRVSQEYNFAGVEELARIRQGIAAWRTTGAAVFVPYLSTLLADVSDHLSHTAEGVQTLVEAHSLVEQHEERY
jgi:hypothetical protein